ncbi:hypothetical protein SNEBB_006383 [Seison nebaliae]|nr:hypothetical protein SNEBB_006383 [Seison nebaliae]
MTNKIEEFEAKYRERFINDVPAMIWAANAAQLEAYKEKHGAYERIEKSEIWQKRNQPEIFRPRNVICLRHLIDSMKLDIFRKEERNERKKESLPYMEDKRMNGDSPPAPPLLTDLLERLSLDRKKKRRSITTSSHESCFIQEELYSRRYLEELTVKTRRPVTFVFDDMQEKFNRMSVKQNSLESLTSIETTI